MAESIAMQVRLPTGSGRGQTRLLDRDPGLGGFRLSFQRRGGLEARLRMRFKVMGRPFDCIGPPVVTSLPLGCIR